MKVSLGGITNPCSEIPMGTIHQDARSLFTSCINYMHNEGVSIGYLKEKYTLDEMRTLIMQIYNLEDFYGEFVSENDSDLAMGSRVYAHIKASYSGDKLVPGRTNQDKFKIDYGREEQSERDIRTVLLGPMEEVPLYMNKSNLLTELSNWRLSLGK